MSKYAELIQQYAKYITAEQAYIRELSSIAGNVADGLERYLGADRREGAVRLGTGNEHSFKEATWLELSSLNKVVSFSLALTLKEPGGFGRSTHVIFELNVARLDGTYTFNIQSFAQPVLISGSDVCERRFDPIYELLSERLMRIYDPQQYLL